MSMHKLKRLFGMLGSALALVSCSSGQLLSVISKDATHCIERDVVFDPTHQLAADIYYAEPSLACSGDDSAAEVLRPTVVFVFGGSWESGDKADYEFVAQGLVAEGFNVVVPNYRLYPVAGYPEFIEDVASFFAWLASSGADYSLRTDVLHAMGHSAGAYNLAMYLTDAKYAKPLSFKTFIGLAGPYDFFLPTRNDKYIAVFEKNNPAFNSEDSLPVNQENPALADHVARVLLMHGAKDELVLPRNLESFSRYLKNHGVPVTTKEHAQKGHVNLVTGLANNFIFGNTVKDDIVNFINAR